MGFIAGDYLIKRVNMAGRDLHVLGNQLAEPVDYISFPTEEQPYSLMMDSASREFELTIPGQAEAGAIYFDAQAILGEKIKEIEKIPVCYKRVSNSRRIWQDKSHGYQRILIDILQEVKQL